MSSAFVLSIPALSQAEDTAGQENAKIGLESEEENPKAVPTHTAPDPPAPATDPNILGKAVGVARTALDIVDAVKGDTDSTTGNGFLGVSTPPPSPMIPFFMLTAAGMNWLEANDADVGVLGLVYGTLKWMSYLGIVGSYLMPFLMDDEGQADENSYVGSMSAQTYLLAMDQESALTGQFQREPEGNGLGYDIALEYNQGLIAGIQWTYQQTNIKGTDWVAVTSSFTKFEFMFGIDLARGLGYLTDTTWLKRQRLAIKAGPSWFSNTVRMADEGSGFFVSREDRVNIFATLNNAVGYEVAGELDVLIPFIGGVRVVFQRGSYPSVNVPRINGTQAALVTLIGFDALRRGQSYTWQRFKVDLDIPFVGFTESGRVAIGGQLSKFQSEDGTAVNNRGLSLSANWAF